MPIAFNLAGVIKGVDGGPNVLSGPTSLQFGPDGRLYVSEQNGSINAFTISIEGGEYIATAHEQLKDAAGNEIVKSLQNHFDDGSEKSATNRQVTGIVLGGTAEVPVIYVSSSDPDIATNKDANLDTNSGVVSRATWNPDAGAWDVIDLVRGLPRSEENHSVNGMVLDEAAGTLLLQVGGHTNNGAPSKFFAYTGEYALSGAVLELDLVALDALPTRIDPQGGQNDTQRFYKYDLPTLDDPNIPNDGVREYANGMDVAGPWGGNDGLNMAILPADAPLRLFADGLRNPFDLAQRADGTLWTVDNGSNGGLGNAPNRETADQDGDGIPNEAISTPADGGYGEGEPLFQIVEGGFYQHANPVRSNQNMAWTVYNDNGTPDTNVGVNYVADISARVPASVQIEPGYLIDPSKFAVAPGFTLADLSVAERNARLLQSGQGQDRDTSDLPIVMLGSSTNGIVVYDSGGTAFGGSIDGALFVTQFNGSLSLLNLNAAGNALVPVLSEGPDGIYGTADDVVQDADGYLPVISGRSTPLDVTMGPNGSLWVAEIGSNSISVLIPGDTALPGDPDIDNDGIDNASDPFMRDASNGTSVTVTPGQIYLWDFDANADGNRPGPDGFGGGLTGVMVNGTTDFEAFFQSSVGTGTQLDNVKFITAAGGGTTVIEKVAQGDAYLAENDGAFLFQTGVTLAPNVGTATFQWTVFNPVNNSEGPITGTFQQLGGQIGTGDQSNYLKIVAIKDGAGSGIQIALEKNDVVVSTQTLRAPTGTANVFDGASIPTNAKIYLYLDADVIAGTAVPRATYETTSGDVTLTGAQIDLTGTGVLTALRGEHTVQGQASGLAVGLYSTNTGEAEADAFQAVFDDITITATEAALPPVAGDDALRTGVDTVLIIPVATLLANDTDPNGDALSVTAVAAGTGGSVVLDDNGTPTDGSDDTITFTPTPGFGGDASFGYTVSDGTGTDEATVTVTVADQTVIYRVNAGGAEIGALAGDPYGSTMAWAANTGTGAQSGPGFANNTGNISVNTTAGRATTGDYALPDYVPQGVFTQERWDAAAAPEMVFSFGNGGLSVGTYTVNLFMANGFSGTDLAGERVFDIEIEGQAAFDDVDLVALLGHQVGGMFSWTGQVSDGTLNIEWLHKVENPLINAIEVIGAGAPVVAPDPLVVSIVNGATQTVSEGAGSVQISILTDRPVPAGESVQIEIEIAGVSATPGEGGDYRYDGGGTFAGGIYTNTITIAGTSSDVTIPIAILQDAEIEPNEAFTVTLKSVSANAVLGVVSQATVTILDDDATATPGEVIYRVNAGGAQVADPDGGPVWTADTVAAPSVHRVDRGPLGDNVTYTVTTPPGPGVNATGAPDALFTTERYSQIVAPNGMEYAFAVADGNYTVNLYFDELYFTKAGERVFDVTIEDALVIDDLDTFATYNNDTGLQSFGVTVTDGTLNVSFIKGSADNPHIAAIEIVAAAEGYMPPLDSLFGTALEISDNRLAPSGGGALALGDNIVTATQEGEAGTNGVRDRDYFTFTVAEGQVLTGIFLDDYVNANPSSPAGFFGIQTGSTLTVDPVTGQPDAGTDALLGAVVYGASDVGSDLLARMAAGGEVGLGTGFSLPGFDAPLTGDLTVWLNQGAGPGTPTLRFVVAEAPPVPVPGAWQPNANGNFVIEAEDADDDGPGNWDFLTTADLPTGHEAPSNGGYVEATSNHLSSPDGASVLRYAFTAAEEGFVRVNLLASRNSGTNPDSNTEHNDSWVGVHLNGVPVAAIPQQGTALEAKGSLGLYKAFSSGGDGTAWIPANKNIDNVGKAIVIPVEAGATYDFLLAERSSGHEVDKIVLEFATTAFTSPVGNAGAAGLKAEPISPREAVEPAPEVGEAVLTINANSDNIQVSNFGNGSFTITNTGTKAIEFIEIDVADALLPDAVFDPYGVAGDSTGKALTLNGGSDGGTGLVVPAGGFGGTAADGTVYVGTGGIAGYEKLRLDFTSFTAGKSLVFGLDMDPNSIAGATKSTLDSGATLAGSNWDVGGISGAELIGSSFTVGYADDTTSVGQLQGQGTGQQSGAKALSTQAAGASSVVLTVNGLGAGAEGSYGAAGPTVTISGQAGETARVVVAKGFIVPFVNNFPDTDDPTEYHDQLDAQLATLASSGFPANNFVELIYADVVLDGTVQDITAMFDFANVAAYDLATVGLNEGQLPLGFAASVVDVATDLPKGPVTAPIHLVFTENAAPVVADPGALSVDEGAAISLQIVATDDDTPLTYALELLDGDGVRVTDSTLAIDAAGLITGNAPLVLDATTFTARVTVTDAAGQSTVRDVSIAVADTLADADLSLTKTVSDATPAFGDDVTFTVSVANAGGDDAGGVVVKDLLPDGYALVGVTASAGTYDAATGLWSVGTVAVGGTQNLTLTARVLAAGAPTPDAVLYRINVNGSAQAAQDGSLPGWSVDAAVNTPATAVQVAPGVTVTGGTRFGNNDSIGGNAVPNDIDLTRLGTTPITESALRTERFGNQQWDFAVDSGDYTVNLYFAEIFVGVQGSGVGKGIGDRLFNVSIEGAPALTDYDIFATAGGGRIGVVESFDVTVTDGTLDIDFVTVVDNAKIGAIEVIQKGTDGGPLTYTNFAELFAADVSDPDSTPGNGPSGEDDEASVTVLPTATGVNQVTVATVANAAEPAQDGQFVVTLAKAAATDTTVTYAVGGTATAGADYTALTGTVVIAAGETSAVIDIGVIDDAVVEDPETVAITLTDVTGDANLALGSATKASAIIADDDLPPVTGSALIKVTPGGNLEASTFGGTDKFQIINLGAANITSVSIDLATGILPDMVFDPTGSGGDATAQVFTANAALAAATGLVAFADNGVDPFSQARNGGFDRIAMEFTDFQQGETFTFSVDIDPNSIQGVAGAGNAGAVSGYELVGATLTITFDDGTSQAVVAGSLFEDGSLGGAAGVVSTETTLAAPTIELLGAGADESPLPGDQVSVSDGASQVVRITGTAGATVTLLQMDARLFIASGDDPFDVQPDEAAFYANEAMSGKTLYTAVVGAGGSVDIPVSLLTTPGPVDTPDGGLNHFVAVQTDGAYVPGAAASQTSATLVVRQVDATNTPPVITTADAFEFVERDIGAVFTAAATDADGDPLTFTLGGADAGLFTFDGTTASFTAAPLFNDGGANAFDLTLTASDGTDSVTQDITVSILKDSDADLVPDIRDNATFVFNPDQRDTDDDGYGNVVDADLNNDRIVNVFDLAMFSAAFGLTVPGDDKGPVADADFDGSGSVDVLDLAIFSGAFGAAPGPAAIDTFDI